MQSVAQDQLYHCSFCGKNQEQVRYLVAGPKLENLVAIAGVKLETIDYRIHICNECVEMASEIIEEAQGQAKTDNSMSKASPALRPRDAVLISSGHNTPWYSEGRRQLG